MLSLFPAQEVVKFLLIVLHSQQIFQLVCFQLVFVPLIVCSCPQLPSSVLPPVHVPLRITSVAAQLILQSIPQTVIYIIMSLHTAL